MSSSLILHVEDDESDALLLDRALKRAGLGVKVYRVENGQEAIAYLDGAGKFADRATYPLPGLVLLDIKMPGLHGFEVLKWIRQAPRFAHLPVVMLSSSDEAGDIQEARRLGANCYLVKQSGYLEVVKFLGALRVA